MIASVELGTGGSQTIVPPLPSLANLKFSSVYDPLKVTLAVSAPSVTVRMPSA